MKIFERFFKNIIQKLKVPTIHDIIISWHPLSSRSKDKQHMDDQIKKYDELKADFNEQSATLKKVSL